MEDERTEPTREPSEPSSESTLSSVLGADLPGRAVMEFLGDGAELRLASRAVNTESDERDEEIGYERWRSCDRAVLAFADTAGKVVARSSDDVVDPLPCDRWAHFSALAPMRVAELVRDLMLDIAARVWEVAGLSRPDGESLYECSFYCGRRTDRPLEVCLEYARMNIILESRGKEPYKYFWSFGRSDQEHTQRLLGEQFRAAMAPFRPAGLSGLFIPTWRRGNTRSSGRRGTMLLRLFGT